MGPEDAGTPLGIVHGMNNTQRITKNYMTAGIAALAAAVSMGIAAQSQAPKTSLPTNPAAEELVITEPAYVIVDRAPGAPMATGELPVQVVVIDEPLAVHVGPRPVVAQISRRSPASEVQVMVHR